MNRSKYLAGTISFMTFLFVGVLANAQNVSLDKAVKDAATEIGNTIPAKSKLAVLSFKSDSDRMSGYIIEELTTEIVNQRKQTVVDRAQLDLIRQEMDFQLSGEVSDESAQAIGKKLGAQSIVSGSLELLGDSYRFRIKVIEVESAAVQMAFNANVENDKLLASLMSTGNQGASTGQKVGTGFLNLGFGAGSFIMGDLAGGLTLAGGYAVAAGLIIWELVGLTYKDEIAGIPGTVGLGVAGITAVYGFIRPFIYNKGYTQVSGIFNGINIAVIPDSRGVISVGLSYTYKF
jgi:TolB-like protein